MSTWGLLVRFFGGMAIGVAAVGLAIGCATAVHQHASAGGVLAAGQERGSWATAAELAWLRRLGVWEKRLLRSLERAANVSSEAKARRVAGPIQHCTDNLRGHVGRPPTARLERALQRLEQACGHLEDAVGSPNAASAEREGRQGGKLLLQADRLLPPGETRSLPVVAGVAVESHVDPKFSRIASALAGKDVEVRCWSRVDWTRLLREEDAYTLHHIDGDTLGFAGIQGRRDNLSPEVCDGLGQLAYDHWQPTAGSAKVLLASAIVTLSHEPQHSKGIVVEAQAECYAIQAMKESAIKLGARPGYAAALQKVYWEQYDQELPAYRSTECRNGGKYDLHPAQASFP